MSALIHRMYTVQQMDRPPEGPTSMSTKQLLDSLESMSDRDKMNTLHCALSRAYEDGKEQKLLSLVERAYIDYKLS